MRSPRRSAPLLAALLLAALGGAARGMEYVPDEVLWMHQWPPDYILPFPYAAALKPRDAEAARALQGPLAGYPANSLNGPDRDAAVIERRVEADARRWAAGAASAGRCCC